MYVMYLKGRAEKEETDFPSTGVFPKMLQQPGARNWSPTCLAGTSSPQAIINLSGLLIRK